MIRDFQSVAEKTDFFGLGFQVFALRVGEDKIEHSDTPLNIFDFVFATVADVLAVNLAVEPAGEQVIDLSESWRR